VSVAWEEGYRGWADEGEEEEEEEEEEEKIPLESALKFSIWRVYTSFSLLTCTYLCHSLVLCHASTDGPRRS